MLFALFAIVMSAGPFDKFIFASILTRRLTQKLKQKHNAVCFRHVEDLPVRASHDIQVIIAGPTNIYRRYQVSAGAMSLQYCRDHGRNSLARFLRKITIDMSNLDAIVQGLIHPFSKSIHINPNIIQYNSYVHCEECFDSL